MLDKYEEAGEDEEQVVTVDVTKDMTPEEVIKKTLEMLEIDMRGKTNSQFLCLQR